MASLRRCPSLIVHLPISKLIKKYVYSDPEDSANWNKYIHKTNTGKQYMANRVIDMWKSFKRIKYFYYIYFTTNI